MASTGARCPRIAGARGESVESAGVLVGAFVFCLGLWLRGGSSGGWFDLVDLSDSSYLDVCTRCDFYYLDRRTMGLGEEVACLKSCRV